MVSLLGRTLVWVNDGNFEPIPLTGARSLVAAIANIFMAQGLKASELSWNYPAWSISVEFAAYLAFPFVLLKLRRLGCLAGLAAAAAMVAVLVYLAYVTGDRFNQWDGSYALLRGLPEFALGILLYRVFSETECTWLSDDIVALGVLAAVLISLHVGFSDLLTVGLFALLILTAVANSGRFALVLNSRPLIWLGEISYSIYLLHGLVQYATEEILRFFGIGRVGDFGVSSSLALSGAMIAVCLLLAAITYPAIEVPGRTYLRDALDVCLKRLRPSFAVASYSESVR